MNYRSSVCRQCLICVWIIGPVFVDSVWFVFVDSELWSSVFIDPVFVDSVWFVYEFIDPVFVDSVWFVYEL